MNSTICYRCGFEIKDRSPKQDGWQKVIKLVRKWINNQIQNRNYETQTLGQPWFWEGGEQRIVQILVRTAACNNNDTGNKSWAVEITQPDKNITFRKWKTSISLFGITKDKFIFQMQNEFEIDSNYVGTEIDCPEYTVPWIVTNIISDNNLFCVSGKFPILDTPIALKFLDAGKFQEQLYSPDKTMPFILITPERDTGKYLINPNNLAKILKGSAQVFYTENNSDLEEEFRETLGRRFFLCNGAVRIYYPDVDNHKINAYKRHRFIRKYEFERSSSDEITDVLIKAIIRKNISLNNRYPLSITDVTSLDRKIKMQSLSVNAQSSTELVNYALEENKKLSEEVFNLKELLVEKDSEIQYLEEEKIRQQNKCFTLNTALQSKSVDMNSNNTFDLFPNSLLSVFDWFIAIYPRKITCSERGKLSIIKSDYKDFERFWNALKSLLFLWDVGSKKIISRNLCDDFLKNTGFELSLNETKSTSKNPKLARQRDDEFEGINIDITKHVRLDDNTTRIYYDFIPEKQLIVIGHIGHLDTAGTRINAKK